MECGADTSEAPQATLKDRWRGHHPGFDAAPRKVIYVDGGVGVVERLMATLGKTASSRAWDIAYRPSAVELTRAWDTTSRRFPEGLPAQLSASGRRVDGQCRRPARFPSPLRTPRWLGRDHPALWAMGLENVFLSARPLIVSLARSTIWSSTSFGLQQPKGPAFEGCKVRHIGACVDAVAKNWARRAMAARS